MLHSRGRPKKISEYRPFTNWQPYMKGTSGEGAATDGKSVVISNLRSKQRLSLAAVYVCARHLFVPENEKKTKRRRIDKMY